ncbi:armadillo-type protein [Tuber indicum]|nr:armadillo-type protein [Tuber indicum]
MANASTPFALQSLLEKMSSPDSDYRFMSLNDLLSILTSPNASLTQADSNLTSRVIDGVVKALDDANGEVQNLAVKCLGPLVLKVRDNQIAPLIDRLTTLSMTSTDPSIPSTALRTIISSLPRPVTVSSATPGSPVLVQKPDAIHQTIAAAVQAIQKTLYPKLLILLKPGTETVKGGGASLDSIDLLIETLKCFGPVLGGKEVEQLQVAVMELLESDRTSQVVKKRAVTSLSLLCVYSPDELLSSFINHLIESFRAQGKHVNPTRLRLLVSVAGALARDIPDRFGPYLKTLCPFILSVVDGKDIQDRELGDEPEMEMDEVREAALVSLESFMSFCTSNMTRFTEDVLNAGMIYLKYDPNYADPADEEDDEEMGGTQQDDGDEDDDFGGSDDEDAFEEDGNFSDEDDISWKVRRCAAKLLSTVLSTRAADLILGEQEGGGKAYKQVAPLLVERFHEREENVRLEVLATATVLVRKTGEVAQGTFTPSTPSRDRRGSMDIVMGPPPKRRRGSDASMLDSTTYDAPKQSSDENGVKNSLQALMPRLSKSLSKLLKTKSTTLPTKQASVTLLSTIVSVLEGGLDGVLGLFIEPLVDATRGGSAVSGSNVVAATAAGGSAATATGSSLRIEVLRLVGKICENHPAQVVGEHFDTLIPAMITAVGEPAYKISSEALNTVVSIVRLLTAEGSTGYSEYLKGLYDVIVAKVGNGDADLEVRERAIVALGVLLSRTSGQPDLIGPNRRAAALGMLVERAKNETTRITAVRAIEVIARNAKTTGDVTPDWVKTVVVECGIQLRKANRTLRGASLDALRSISANENCRKAMDPQSKRDLVDVLTTLLPAGDMHLLAPTLTIVRWMMIDGDGVYVTPGINEGVCGLVRNNLGSGLVVESLLGLVKAIGENDPVGKKTVMNGLLQDVGVNGETSIVAKVVAQLLVSGGGKRGGFTIGVEEFVGEVVKTTDDKRKCLALMVLGEIGLRMGPSFSVGPETFLQQFHAKSDDVPIAAAVALGLASAGNVQGYLPVIMQRLGGGDKDQYLLLHSLKEIIQHSDDTTANIKPYADQIWKALFSMAKNDDSKAVGAECVGRLTIIDPYSYLPELQKHLQSESSAIRGMVISALRYTFTDTEASYDDLLRPIVVDFLTVMVDDKELENRRLALTALNSAAHNKPHLIGQHLQSLLPLVYRETVVRPELVREVQMGPFKHKVDDGLEVRKSAYETLYALLETSFSGIEIQTYFDRVIAGLQDEHDIRVLCNLMLTKLILLAKGETLRRLDSIAECFKTTLNQKPKDNAVKQELEKHAESIRSTMRATVALNRTAIGAGVSGKAGWSGYWEWAKAVFPNELQVLEGDERAE